MQNIPPEFHCDSFILWSGSRDVSCDLLQSNFLEKLFTNDTTTSLFRVAFELIFCNCVQKYHWTVLYIIGMPLFSIISFMFGKQKSWYKSYPVNWLTDPTLFICVNNYKQCYISIYDVVIHHPWISDQKFGLYQAQKPLHEAISTYVHH